jgi:phytoene dehydrogenase-like protein
MSKKYDVVVIGAGHNGLIAATTLARKNRKVLVLEKRPIIGGIAAGEEFHPGYKTVGLLHDTAEVRSDVIKNLDLEKHGLQFKNSRPVYSILSKNGECLHLDADVEKAAAEIAKFSTHDADTYREYQDFIGKIRGFIKGLMNEIPPDLMDLGGKQIWELAKKGMALKKLGKKTMMELLKVAPMSVADFLNEKFETDFIKAGIAGPAIYGSYTGPWSSYTTLNLLIWECVANCTIVGGPQALITAVERAAKDAGVEIKTSATVDSILLNKERNVIGVKILDGEEIQTDVVAASCTPATTFFDLLKPNQVDYSLEHGIQHYRSRGTTAKVNLAINTTVKFNGESAEFFRTGNSFDEMEKAFDHVKYREFSNEPILDIHIPTKADPSLAPEGHQVISVLVHFAPHHFEEGWSESTKSKLYDRVIKTLELYAPEIASGIVGSEVLSPVDLEKRYGLTNGHIFHGEHAVDQLITRPIPSCSRYKTPIHGLYLCGGGSHPGGGITGMPGYLGAKMILENK